MTVRANKPAFNIREKLKSLDYSHLPYEKMPAGSVVQVVHNMSTTESGGTTIGGGTEHLAVPNTSITPYLPGSKILIIGGISTWVQHTSSTVVYGKTRIKRNNITIQDTQGAEFVFGPVTEWGLHAPLEVLDNPSYSVGETINYSLYWVHSSPGSLSTLKVNRTTTYRGSSITIMEIAQ